MDENERIALQEAEDERLAREMMQSEDSEVRGEEGEERGGREGKEGVIKSYKGCSVPFIMCRGEGENWRIWYVEY